MLRDCKSAAETTELARAGQKLLSEIESSKKPFIAAIKGT